MSLFSDTKAWELTSLLTSARERLGVERSARDGGHMGAIPPTATTPPSSKKSRNSLSRYVEAASKLERWVDSCRGMYMVAAIHTLGCNVGISLGKSCELP